MSIKVSDKCRQCSKLSVADAIAQARTQGFAYQDTDEQLLVAGDAIAQIVQIYIKRANGILDSLKVTDSSEGSILGEDF